ncbi:MULTISPECIES: HNH endonuclease [unclassified Streptomyces]|uniref:HNH endonuclease n=1 Tax=unclassified Streptomyces TaxID=2593676 RepID=UPI00331DE077
MGSQLRVGEVLRSGRDTDAAKALIDGYPNIHHVTASRILPQIQLSKGINAMAKVKAPDGRRHPAVLIRSSPWKAGSAETPWHDVFDLDNGRVRYFGDHRVEHNHPLGSRGGNKTLLEVFAGHQALTVEQRAAAVPLLVFEAATRNRTPKGYVAFRGVAVIEQHERIEQETAGQSFPNYRYELAVLDLSADEDRVDWSWIEARGNTTLAASDTLDHAPRSWRRWVEHGHAVLPEVRRRVSDPVPGSVTSRRTAGNDRKQPALFPSPRQQDEAAATSLAGAGPLEELTAATLLARLKGLRVHQQEGRRSRHKPLALMWGISRVAAGKPHLAPWPQFRVEAGALLSEFGLPDSAVTPEYPFWRLQTSLLWHVHGVPHAPSDKVHAATLDRFNAEGGLTEQAAKLLEDPYVRSQAFAILREHYLADVNQHDLMARLGLSGYEIASGVVDTSEEEQEYVPAPRRTHGSPAIVRNTALTAQVKSLYGDRCQICGLQLSTRYGTYSEAAHIRGLGRPHHGPDELPNLLVLCPNHHVQFDTLALYIDIDDTIRMTADDSPTGKLRRHPDHQIREHHLRYHRALCGRDTTTLPSQGAPHLFS